MMLRDFTICGTGCALADFLYTNVDFSDPVFRKYLSKHSGDGGLSPGRLVFTGEFEKFAGVEFGDFLKEVTGGKKPDRFNIGGPSLVALIHAAQLLTGQPVSVRFFGARGKDETGARILEDLKKLPVDISGYRILNATTPFTDVFSDPGYDHGVGERIFVNNLGAAELYTPRDLPEEFFSADMTIFGGTALVPQIHDHLSGLLSRARQKGAFTVVNTVYDFRNESKNPDERWPMGDGDESYPLIDLLITDREEALRLSGTKEADEALDFFRSRGVKAVIITQGHKPVYLFADERYYNPVRTHKMPVSAYVSERLKQGANKGDTTGCGDNFAGGIVASLAMQKLQGRTKPDLTEAVIWGIASGGAACFYTGGTYIEQKPGEKLKNIEYIVEKYKEQTGF